MSATTPVGCQLTDFLDPLPNLIPSLGITLLSGAPNVGKTALLAGIARDFRDNRSIFGHQPSKLPVIGVICADRGWGRGAGVWFGRVGYADVRYYSMADDPSFNPKSLRRKFERTERLMEMIDKLKLPPGSLVIVDPIALFLGGNLLDYDACACACHEIRVLLRQRGLTLIATAHSIKLKADRKDRYLRLQDQLLGSTAILGFSDTQMYLASPEEIGKPYYAFLWHSHILPPETFCLDRDDQGLFLLWEGADGATKRRVLALLPEDGAEITLGVLKELIPAIPLSLATLKRGLETLIEEQAVERVKHGTYRRVIAH
jgi:hypothetical protein